VIKWTLVAPLTDDSGFQIDENSSGYVFTSAGFTEEGVERIITSTNGFIRGHLSIGLDAMFQTVQFPAGVTDLDTSLTNMD
jgi:hypothetical protein